MIQEVCKNRFMNVCIKSLGGVQLNLDIQVDKGMDFIGLGVTCRTRTFTNNRTGDNIVSDSHA